MSETKNEPNAREEVEQPTRMPLASFARSYRWTGGQLRCPGGLVFGNQQPQRGPGVGSIDPFLMDTVPLLELRSGPKG